MRSATNRRHPSAVPSRRNMAFRPGIGAAAPVRPGKSCTAPQFDGAPAAIDTAPFCGRRHAMIYPVTEHVVKNPHHTTFYLACGAQDAPAIVFCHGWPELSISWRHQLRCFADL